MPLLIPIQPGDISISRMSTAVMLTFPVAKTPAYLHPDYGRMLQLYLQLCQRMGVWAKVHPNELYFRVPQTGERDELKTRASYEALVAAGIWIETSEGYIMTSTGAEKLSREFPPSGIEW